MTNILSLNAVSGQPLDQQAITVTYEGLPVNEDGITKLVEGALTTFRCPEVEGANPDEIEARTFTIFVGIAPPLDHEIEVIITDAAGENDQDKKKQTVGEIGLRTRPISRNIASAEKPPFRGNRGKEGPSKIKKG